MRNWLRVRFRWLAWFCFVVACLVAAVAGGAIEWPWLALLLVGVPPWLLMSYEIREFNGGICRHNGSEWKLCDVDSQGGRMWKSGDFTLWISWADEFSITSAG